LVLLHGQQAHELPAAVVQRAEVADFLGCQGTHRGGGDFAEVAMTAASRVSVLAR